MIDEDGPVRGQPWTRRQREPEQEYGWFLRYAARPPHHRHPNYVAGEVDVDPATVRAACRTWRWSVRARARDTHLERIAARRAESAESDLAAEWAEQHAARMANTAEKRRGAARGWIGLIGANLANAAREQRDEQ